MSQYVFTLHQLSKVVDQQRYILKDISLSFFPGAKIGILGLNGSGKSSLLKIMAGVDKNFNGEARPQAGLKIGYLPQEPVLDLTKTVKDIVQEGVAELLANLQRFEDISMKFAEPMTDDEMEALLKEQGDLQHDIEAAQGWDLDRRLEIAADALRLPEWDAPISILSGGERRRVALCRLLLSNPDMLLLDEPTNHLDAESVAWLERYLETFTGTVVAVTHDRYFLDHVAEWILELDRGEGIPFKGNYSAWLEYKNIRIEQEQKKEQAHHRALTAELEWVRSSPKARQAKSKARLARFEELQSKTFQKRQETNEIFIPPGDRLGDLVIEVDQLAKSYGEKLLFDKLTLNLPKGGIMGIIGANGAGKSTFLKLLSQQDSPDSGEIRFGDTVKLAHIGQFIDNLQPNHTVWQAISGGLDMLQIGGTQMPSRAYVGRFNFKGSDQQKRVEQLSGGERNRVNLAKLLIQGANVLLLDEPSNDLDVETLRALEEALLSFPGCAIVVSHDRWFLDRICTHMLVFEGNSEVTFMDGNYSDYEAYRQSRLGEQSKEPTRIRYRPFHTH